jgi:hypothetical protein
MKNLSPNPSPKRLCFTHKSQDAVGAKHLGDRLELKTRIFLSKCFALPRDRIILKLEGEAFAQKYLGTTEKIKHECFAPTGFQEMWVMHSLRGEGSFAPPSQNKSFSFSLPRVGEG